MKKYLYETTRRRRVYKLTIDWKTENRRLVLSNINQYRADELRAKKVAIDERNKVLLTQKESTLEDYNKVLRQEYSNLASLNTQLLTEKQNLLNYQNKTTLKAERAKQQVIRDENKAKADSLEAQINALDKKQTKQLADLMNQFSYHYGLYFKANVMYDDYTALIDDPTYYANDIKSTKANIKEIEAKIEDSNDTIRSFSIESITAENTYNVFQKIVNEVTEKLKQTEMKDVIANISGLRVDFSMDKSLFGGTNKLSLKIYNLPQEYRDALYQNLYLYTSNELKKHMYVSFSVGYEGDVLYNIFNGDLAESFSYQQGLDIITEIQAWDTAVTFERRYNKISIQEDMDRRSFILSVLGKRLPLGKYIAGIDDNLSNDIVRAPINLTDDPLKDIETYAIDRYGEGMNVFVDNGGVYIVSPYTAFNMRDMEQSISSSTNLLETPRFNGGTITCHCLFLPNIRVSQAINLYSEVNTIFSGYNLLETQFLKDKKSKEAGIVAMTGLPAGMYKIVSIKHNGSISDTTESKATTTIELQTAGLYFTGLDVTYLGVSE